MMQYMILTASVLVFFLNTGVNAASPKTRPKAAKLVGMVIHANDSKNKAEPVDIPVRAQAAGCNSYELYGCRYKKGIHGRYSKTSFTCSSKPVYSRYSSYFNETVYLFYNLGQWGFSNIRCSSTGYVQSTSLPNNFPDEVVSWEEVEETPSGTWYKNSGIGVKCVSTPSTLAPTHAPGCDSYELSGCRYKYGIHGWYSKTSYTCSSKPVYSRYSSDFKEMVYLYYISKEKWVFSDIRCSSTGYVQSSSIQNNFPDKVVSWEEVDTSGNWYRNSGIGVKCGSTPSTLAPTQAPDASDTANINPLVMLILVCGCVATW